MEAFVYYYDQEDGCSLGTFVAGWLAGYDPRVCLGEEDVMVLRRCRDGMGDRWW